jgi:hypothetical protein
VYLKEFDLDLPYRPDESVIERIMAERHCTHDEATRFDYESNWKDKRRLFCLQTRCVTSMFERVFGRRKMKTTETWKVLVECVEIVTDYRVRPGEVACVQVKCDFDQVTKSTDYQKKQAALELLVAGIEKVALQEQWDLTQFRFVYNRIRELEYNNEWVWRKPLKSPDRKHSAEVQCNHQVNAIDIYLVVRDKMGEQVIRQHIISELPNEWAYARHLGELQWRSNTEVILLNKAQDSSGGLTLQAGT